MANDSGTAPCYRTSIVWPVLAVGFHFSATAASPRQVECALDFQLRAFNVEKLSRLLL